jgi:hypothetical protein
VPATLSHRHVDLINTNSLVNLAIGGLRVIAQANGSSNTNTQLHLLPRPNPMELVRIRIKFKPLESGGGGFHLEVLEKNNQVYDELELWLAWMNYTTSCSVADHTWRNDYWMHQAVVSKVDRHVIYQ